MRHEAFSAIQNSWSSDQVVAFALLDRLVVVEQQHDDDDGEKDNDDDDDSLSDLVNLAVASWQKADDETRVLEPRQIMEKLELYRTKGGVHPTIQTYTMVLDVAVKQGDAAPELAETIMDILKSQNIHPDQVFYSTVIMAYAKSGQEDAALRAQAILEKLIAAGDVSNAAYIGTITAWANNSSRQHEAPQRAEALLEAMYADPLCQPDTKAFAAVLNAWAKSNHKNASHRALAILNRMQELPGIKTNAIVYTTVMDAFAKQGKAVEAEQLLNELTQKYEATQDQDYLPTVVAFSVVIDAWSKSNHPKAAIRAEAILERMQELSQDKPELQPNVVSFNCVLHAWAVSRHSQAPERAETILNLMHNLYVKSGNGAVKPNAISMTTVINSWAKNSRRDLRAAPRAEAILNHMCQLYNEGDTDMKPDIVCFTAVMDAYAKSPSSSRSKVSKNIRTTQHQQQGGVGVVDVPKKVEELLDRMQESFGIQPNVYSYAVGIHAWVRHAASSQEAVQHAEVLFQAAQDQYYKNNNKDCKPNVVLYNSLIAAYAKNGDATKAQRTLEQMESSGDVDILPTVITYNSVLNGCSKSREKGSLQKAEALLERMRQHSEIQPDAFSFGSVIAGWARDSKNPEAADRALEYFEELKILYKAGNNERCKPTVVTYTSVMNALSRRQVDRDEAADQVLQLLQEMKRHGEVPNAITYRYVLESLSRGKDRATAAFAILNEMDEQNMETSVSWHLDYVLQACVWTKGSAELKRDASKIARQVYQRIRNPTVSTYEHMIGLAASSPDKGFVEHLYKECQQRRYDSNAKIHKAIQRFAPYLLDKKR